VSSNLSEICRVETEVQDLASTLRVMIQLSIREAWPLFREIFLRHPDLTAENLFGATLLVVGECKRPFDADEVLRLLTKKLERAVQFSRLTVDMPQSEIVEFWRIYENATLPDSFFSTSGFQSAWSAFKSIQSGTQPRTIN
jgi:hypothetical protein